MIGRDEELSRLEQLLHSGGSALVVIDGGPRSGKARLLWEFRQRTPVSGQACRLIPAEDPDNPDAAPWLAINKQMTVDEFARQLAPLVEPESATTLSGSENEVVLIYGYRPEPRFHRWFLTEFLSDLAGSGPQRLVVLAGSHADVGELVPLAAAHIELGPLPGTAVLDELQRIDETLADRLTEQEFDLYSDAIKDDPSLLDAMRHLLPMSGTPETIEAA